MRKPDPKKHSGDCAARIAKGDDQDGEGARAGRAEGEVRERAKKGSKRGRQHDLNTPSLWKTSGKIASVMDAYNEAFVKPLLNDDDPTVGFVGSWKEKGFEGKPSSEGDVVFNELFQWEAGDTDITNAMKAPDKKAAFTAANTSASENTQIRSSSGALARQIGLGVNDSLRPSLKIPIGSKCVSFLDSDSRQVMYNSFTDCFDKSAKDSEMEACGFN